MWEGLAAAVLAALVLLQPGIAQEQKQCGKVVYIVVDRETAEKLSELGGVVPDDVETFAVGFGKIATSIISKISKPGYRYEVTEDPEKLQDIINQFVKRPCQEPPCQPGWEVVGGVCYLPEPPTCAVDEVNKNGNCVPTPEIACPDGTELTAEKKSCKHVPNFVCDRGMSLFGDTCLVPWTCDWWEGVECFVSPSGECPEDFTDSGPYCMKPVPPGPPIPVPPECENGKVQSEDGQCIYQPPCQPGWEIVGEVCHLPEPPKCESGKVQNEDGRCVYPPTFSCSKGEKKGNLCIVEGISTCTEGFKLVDNACYPDWSCESWYGGECILTPTGICPPGTTKTGLFCLYPPPKPSCAPGSEPSSDYKNCIRPFVPGVECPSGYEKLEINRQTFCSMIAPMAGFIFKPQCAADEKLSEDGLFCYKPFKLGSKCPEGFTLLEINGRKMCAKAAPIPSVVAKPECDADETLSPDGLFCFKPLSLGVECPEGKELIVINGQKFCAKAAPIPQAWCDPGFTPSPDGKLCMKPFKLGVGCSEGFELIVINGQKFCAKAAPKCGPGHTLADDEKWCYIERVDAQCPNGYKPSVSGSHCFGVALGEEGKCKRGEQMLGSYCYWYIQLGAHCPAGYRTHSDKTTCSYKIPGSGYGVVCPTGTTLSENQKMCEQSLNAEGKCPAGWWVSDDKTHCFKMMIELGCSEGHVLSEDGRSCLALSAESCEPHQVFRNGHCINYGTVSDKCDLFSVLKTDESGCVAKLEADGTCPPGYEKAGHDPVPCLKYLLVPLGCRWGEQRSSKWCYRPLGGRAECPSDYFLYEDDCWREADTSATCPDGQELKNDYCYDIVILEDLSGGKCVLGATISEDKSRCLMKAEFGAACPSGYDKSGGWCFKIIAAPEGCEFGDKLSDDKLFCLRTLTSRSSECPGGYTKSGTVTCYKRVAGGSTGHGWMAMKCGKGQKSENGKCIPTSQEGCPENTVYQNFQCYTTTGTHVQRVEGCEEGDQLKEIDGQNFCVRSLTGAKCPDGYQKVQEKFCYKLVAGSVATSSLSMTMRCGKGQKLEGNQCIPTSQEGCPAGTTYSNYQCFKLGASTGCKIGEQLSTDKKYCIQIVAEEEVCATGYRRHENMCFIAVNPE